MKVIIENSILIMGVFVLTMVLAPYYVNGDQFYYRFIYEGLKGLSLINGFIYYTSNLNSKEIIHFFLSWLATNQGIEKDLFVASSNAVLVFSAIGLMRKINVSIWIIVLIIFTNFYFYVLYFAGERLKFGFIFFFFSLLYIKRFYMFTLLSIFSHIQMIIFYGAISFNMFFKLIIKDIVKFFIKGKITKKSLLTFILLPVVFFLIYSILSGHLISKFQAYSEGASHGVNDLMKIFVLFIMTLWYSKNKKEVMLIFIPLLIAVYLVGGARVNMMAYFIFLYYALPVNRGFNMGILATSVYFCYATYKFIVNIIEHGNGFYGI